MNTFEAICSRRSIRSFTGEEITQEELQKILTAAQASPVGMKAYDSLILSVVTNRQLLQRIDKNCGEYLHMTGTPMLFGVPMLIIVSSKMAPAPNDNTAYSNAAIMVQNMALEAVELGVGIRYLWAAVFALNRSPELLTELRLPEGYVPCCALGLGKTEETYQMREIPSDRVKVLMNQ